MTDRAAYAKQRFEEGLNCAQAVFAAFSDITGIDEDMSLRLSSSFGGGMGRMREVCGALSGAFLVAGVLWGNYDPTDGAAKKAHYARIQQIAAEFREENGDILCRNILGLKTAGPDDPTPAARTREYYASRSCGDCVASAAAILQRMIDKESK